MASSAHRWLLLMLTTILTVAATVGQVWAYDTSSYEPAARSFAIEDDCFLRDGERVQLLAGSIHYFRVPPQYWEDRMRRLQALGLNTVQTLIPWNVHEGPRAHFSWEGSADLEGFLRTAQRLGLMVMLRLGPYICAEHEFGGFPAYLLREGPMVLRSSDPHYLAEVDHWWAQLLPRVKPLLWQSGGPVIMVQVENEYGWFGRDHAYLQHLVDSVRAALGPDVIVYTTDTAFKWALDGGTLSGDAVYTVVDFNIYANPSDAFALQRLYNAPGKSPPMTAEFYTGWHTRWGEPLSHSDPAVVAAGLERILAINASLSLYMGHGGTNFGFNSGANVFSEVDYRPVITSYDYGAPISEGGDTELLPLFKALRTAFSRHASSSLPPLPPPLRKTAYGPLRLQTLMPLLDQVAALSTSPHGIPLPAPAPMEHWNQSTGFVLYTVMMPPAVHPGSMLELQQVHDRAQVFVRSGPVRTFIGTVARWAPRTLRLPPAGAVAGATLEVLVENMGRSNFGAYMWDPKGVGGVLLDGLPLANWLVFPLPLSTMPSSSTLASHDGRALPVVSAVSYGPPLGRFVPPACKAGGREAAARAKMHATGPSPLVALQRSLEQQHEAASAVLSPTFFRGMLSITRDPNSVQAWPADTFLNTRGWGKGVAWVNGVHLGHYWPMAGPQCTLYVPGPVLRYGDNEVVLLELEAAPVSREVGLEDLADYTCSGSKAFFGGIAI